MKQSSRHQCIIYSGAPSQKLPTIAATMIQMMEDGYRCLYMNSASMVAGIRSCLASMGIDVASHLAENRFVLSSEPVTKNQDFDITQMLQKLEDMLDQALNDGYKGLWASGDMTWEFGSEKNFEKLLEYESKLEALFQRRKELHGICQYHYDTLPAQVLRRGLLMHSTVYINETLSRLNPHFIRSVLPSETMAANPMLDEMITELCQANYETNRKLSDFMVNNHLQK
jgi:hypothetical protein